MVTRELTHSLRVHSGGNFLDNQKIRVCKRDSDSIINVKVCSRESKLVVACVRRSADVLYGVEAGIEYVLVDIESKESLCKFEPKAELIHISANGNVAVDRDFTFYSLRTGDLLFQFKENVSLAGFLSYFTDDGEIFLYLNTDKGTLNAIDIGRKKLISSCMYHKYQSNLDKLQGRHSISTLLPLYGGYHAVIMDSSQIKQYCLMNFSCWRNLSVRGDDANDIYSNAMSRATYLHSQYEQDHSAVEVINVAAKLRFIRVENVYRMNSKIAPISASAQQVMVS